MSTSSSGYHFTSTSDAQRKVHNSDDSEEIKAAQQYLDDAAHAKERHAIATQAKRKLGRYWGPLRSANGTSEVIASLQELRSQYWGGLIKPREIPILIWCRRYLRLLR